MFDRIWLTGRIASTRADVIASLQDGGLEQQMREVYASAGYGEDSAGYLWGPAPQDLRIETALCIGVFEDGEAEYRYLSDDQAVCAGYAVADEKTNHLPPAHWLARRIGRALVRLRAERGAGEVGPDGKVVVRVRRDAAGWTPEHVSISLNHHEHIGGRDIADVGYIKGINQLIAWFDNSGRYGFLYIQRYLSLGKAYMPEEKHHCS